MLAWWGRLSVLNQAFFVSAVFFSVLFLWQLFSSLTALGDGAGHDLGGHDFGGHELGGHDAGAGHAGHFGPVEHAAGDHMAASAHDAATHDADHAHNDGLSTFRLLSIRSILAFGTLFSWAGALYLRNTLFPGLAVLRATLWGLAGMVTVALFFWILPRLTEEGTANLDTAIGELGQVYLTIPEDGTGQVRVLVSGVMSFVRARSRNGVELPAGTSVRVIRRLDAGTLEVDENEA
ncbi:MAG: NfeD family protein [Anaerolineae bacterium]